MIKLFFWVKDHMWRILLTAFIVFYTLSTFGKTHSYLEAFVALCALYSMSWLSTMAYIEGLLNKDTK